MMTNGSSIQENAPMYGPVDDAAQTIEMPLLAVQDADIESSVPRPPSGPQASIDSKLDILTRITLTTIAALLFINSLLVMGLLAGPGFLPHWIALTIAGGVFTACALGSAYAFRSDLSRRLRAFKLRGR